MTTAPSEFFDTERGIIGSSQEVGIDLFISGKIDYSQVGTPTQQMNKLIADYESVGYRSLATGQRTEVDNAYMVYFKAIIKGNGTPA